MSRTAVSAHPAASWSKTGHAPSDGAVTASGGYFVLQGMNGECKLPTDVPCLARHPDARSALDRAHSPQCSEMILNTTCRYALPNTSHALQIPDFGCQPF